MDRLVYEIRLEKDFVKRMDDLKRLFDLSDRELVDVRETIIDAIEVLSTGEPLAAEFKDHQLTGEPWTGYHEFHVLSDLLVIYYKIDRKKEFEW